MGDTLERITQFNAGREPERLALKYSAMRANPFAFLRGTAHLFWEDWPKDHALNAAPLAWNCGDLHLENFGSYRGDNRLAYFDINDFDDSALAPVTRDITRFVTGVHLAASALGLSPADAGELGRGFIVSYSAALADGKARWVERATATGMVKQLLRAVKRRTRGELLDLRTTRTGDRRRLKIDGIRALKLSRNDRTQVSACLAQFARTQRDPGFYDVIDVARRVAGTGSLGVPRFVVLVRGRGSPNGNMLLDLKQARPSALANYAAGPQPEWKNDATRVVAIQRRMQAIAPALLHAVSIGKGHFVLRELQPMADRLSLESSHGKLGRLHSVIGTMGHLVAWAQLRSSAHLGSAGPDDLSQFARSKGWQVEVAKYARQYSEQVQRDWENFSQSLVPATRG